MWEKIKLFVVCLVLLLFSSCQNEPEKKTYKYFDVESVSTGSMNIEEELIGYSKPYSQVDVSPQIWWKVLWVYVDRGQRVEKWDLLFELSLEESSIQNSTATSMIQSLTQMKRALIDSYSSQIKVLKSEQEALHIELNSTTKERNDLTERQWSQKDVLNAKLAEIQVRLSTAEINFEENKAILQNKEELLFHSGESIITQSLILHTKAISFVDELLWATAENKRKNDDFEDYLWIKDSKQREQTKKRFLDVYKDFNSFKDFYDRFIEIDEVQSENVLKWLLQGKMLSQELKIVLKDIYEVLDNSVVNVTLTQEQLDSYKESVITLGEQLEQSIFRVEWSTTVWLEASYEEIKRFQKERKKQIRLLEQNIQLIQQQLSTIYSEQKAVDVNIDTQRNNFDTQADLSITKIKSIQSQMQSLEDQRDVEVSDIDMQIKKLSWEKDIAFIHQKYARVYSPLSWVIIKKYVDQGEFIGQWELALQLANDSQLKIEVWVPDSILLNLTVWQELQIRGAKNAGVIYMISPNKEPSSGKTTIELRYNNHNRELMLWGSPRVVFPLSQLRGIEIKSSSIIEKFWIAGVYVFDGKRANFREITILERREEVSLIEWLEVWESVIVSWVNNIFDGELLRD